MKFRLAAFLDVFMGKPLLSFVSVLPPRPKRISKGIAFKRVLVMKFWGMGSILEATPFLRTVRQEYKNVPIDILTFSGNKQMVENMGLFDKVHVMDFKKGLHRLFLQIAGFIFHYRGKYALIVDLEFFAFFSALMTKMLAPAYAIGFKSFFIRRNRCYSRTVVFDHSSHVRTIFLKFLDGLYIKRPVDLSLSYPIIHAEKKTTALSKFPELNDDNHIRIAVNINSSELCLNRRWPENNFRSLIKHIQSDFSDVRIYLVGDSKEQAVVSSFFESLANKSGIYITAGHLDIIEFSFVLTKMSCLITSDSGPLHIAEALGVPVVCFYGPETPNLYGPLSGASMVFYKNMFCSPCLNTYDQKKSRCMDNQCLKAISPEEVYGQMKEKFFKKAFETSDDAQ